MKYFPGFSLQSEEEIFSQYLIESDYCVAGFSFGAQQALEYVYHSQKRIDRLILLSPAFFQTRKQSFIRAQLRYFDADTQAYIQQFTSNVASPSKVDLSAYIHTGKREELEALLSYVWDVDKLEEIQSRGTVIEVFLGEKDEIIESKDAFDFFKPLVTTYFIKNVGHAL